MMSTFAFLARLQFINTLLCSRICLVFLSVHLFQVCGQADVWGDGVVPEMSAHLEGALNISLDGVYHSPVGSDDTLRPWYGSPSIVEQWIHHLLSWKTWCWALWKILSGAIIFWICTFILACVPTHFLTTYALFIFPVPFIVRIPWNGVNNL